MCLRAWIGNASETTVKTTIAKRKDFIGPKKIQCTKIRDFNKIAIRQKRDCNNLLLQIPSTN